MTNGPAYKLTEIDSFIDPIILAGVTSSSYRPAYFLGVERGATAEIAVLRSSHLEAYLSVRRVDIEAASVSMLSPQGFSKYTDSENVKHVFLADIGDMDLARTTADTLPSLYRFVEPDPDNLPDYLTAHQIKLSYPDEPHHAEAFLVDPLTGDGFIFTKEAAGDVKVYRVSSKALLTTTTGTPTVAQLTLVSVSTGWAVNGGGPCGADISGDGLRILIRDSNREGEDAASTAHATIWERTASQSVDEALAGEPHQIPIAADEPDGTAIAFKHGSTDYAYYVVSDVDGFSATLYIAEPIAGEPGGNYTPTLSSLCVKLGRPFVMTGLIRDILTRKFSVADNIEENELKGLLWLPGSATNILIESAHRWVPAHVEKRPAVIIKRNTYQNTRRGIGDQRQGPHVDAEGQRHFTTYWIGSHTLFCIGGSGAQAEILGSEVQRELTEFGPVIREKMGLMQFQVLQIGAIARLEEAQENFAVPLTVGWAFEERWVLRQEAPLLKHISLTMLLEG